MSKEQQISLYLERCKTADIIGEPSPGIPDVILGDHPCRIDNCSQPVYDEENEYCFYHEKVRRGFIRDAS